MMKQENLLAPTALCPDTWRPILWREWKKSQAAVRLLLFSFVLIFLLIPIDPNGVMLLVGMLLAGQLLAVTLGGSDLSEGAERYAFVMPLRRADYFWARYLAGLVLLVLMGGSAYVMNHYDLHRYFWGLFCESGLAETRRAPYPEKPLGMFSLCALLGYSNSYCMAANVRKVNILAASWFVGLFLTYALPAILFGVWSLVDQRSHSSDLKGMPFLIVSALISALVLYKCFGSYVGKSAPSSEGGASGGSGWRVALIVLAVWVVLSLLLSVA
ncbi:hypothetical protein HW115_08880 [Verrucomicrobiaceae bacterium N1E253]|uniref:Uncharacterized protein n=1 Tax=Oceaniferula marina TaxID=2748318 RepID=A0A851GFN6_9BACT|nr:hypothetical protein [Oceaniferula marina]NWK55722.1 hypothetical protein [Oceaniferula marina]